MALSRDTVNFDQQRGNIYHLFYSNLLVLKSKKVHRNK